MRAGFERIPIVGAAAALVVMLLPAPSIRGQSNHAVTSACPSGALAMVADSVAAAFDTHQFVFIGSTHGGKKPHDFLLCLLSRPAFQSRAMDVLVEWANPVHQSLVDRYLLNLETVPPELLRRAWLDTDAPGLWGRLPLIPSFYDAVRAINRGLNPAQRIRVIGGCEPIDWATVKTAADVALYPYKNNWAAHVITEHFAPNPKRRLLVVYGDAHIHHNGGNMMGPLHATLDRARLFVVGTIGTLDPTEVDRVARLGDAQRPFYVSGGRLSATGPYPRDLFYARNGPLSEHVDAVVYLGPDPDRDLSNGTELTQEERAEVAGRDAIKGDLRQLMQLRYGNRDRWFRSHRNDLPPDPRMGSRGAP